MESHIEAAVADTDAWAEIHALIEVRRKLAQTEAARLITLRQMITAQEALVFVARITDIVTRHIPDKRVLANITLELQQLLHAGDATYELAEP